MATDLGRARAAAARCGVTRLADVTHLDVIGTPVVQAIRPWSCALSVHQGKGETLMAASLGAMMEAIESHFAEAFAGPVVRGAFRDLPPAERAVALSDFACDGQALSDDEPLDWVRGRRIPGGEAFWLPFDVVSLDFTRAGDARLDRSSDGLACRFEAGEATLTALLEAVERDALAEFHTLTAWGRTERRLARSSLSFPWLEAICRRLDDGGIILRLFKAKAVVALPVLVCELVEPASRGLPRGHVLGSGCHPHAETALRRAVFEAIQSRLTAISAVRDDILPDLYREPSSPAALLAWPSPGGPNLAWTDIEGAAATSAEAVAALLDESGYPATIAIDLAPNDAHLAVVKVFVPGLASERRRRRAPRPRL